MAISDSIQLATNATAGQNRSGKKAASVVAVAAILGQAMPHLLRHTAITNVDPYPNARIQQRFACHGSINTTLYRTLKAEQAQQAAERTHDHMDQSGTPDKD